MKSGSVWLSMGVLWVSYSMLFVGYCWLRGYAISIPEAVSPVNYYKGTWPPPLYTGTGVAPRYTGGHQLGQAVRGAVGAVQGAVNQGTL